ncbi:hypothetical protein [Mesorhizobium sp. L-8-10]|uniref:hypothetical protein n=1 Tax=Mesorhizobium sp. L-8-10 TaxID=2744523 RepID=UPI001927B69D|nr:hypothetical protein [Mesorhizobium sp. L-8-10]
MSKSTTSKQTNEPPVWARPLLEKAASEAMNLYNSGVGHNVYNGPTRAPLSSQTLGGMNALMAATGGTGKPITNESINALIPSADIEAQIESMKQRNSQLPMSLPQQNSDSIPDWVLLGANSDDLGTKLRATQWLQHNRPKMGYTTRQVYGGGRGGR